MGRVLLGIVAVAHGLAHASVGVWAMASGPPRVVALVWVLTMIAFLSSGFGLLGWAPTRTHWWPAMLLGTAASQAFLFVFALPVATFGSVVDLVVLSAGYAVMRGEQLHAAAPSPALSVVPGRAHPFLRASAAVVLAYCAVVGLFRPFYMTWGTTKNERAITLPGDERVPDARYRVDHAITIHAPADAVWPWLVQLGQHRGGFYSYAWLERMIGDDIRNADRIHPEWQRLEPGDFIRATQPDYLGGIFGDSLGWRVSYVEPGAGLILDNWGTFALLPVDSNTTRLLIRTRGDGAPSLAGLLLGPLSVFGLEPAHFIMQRGMLRGIRDRAERSVRPQAHMPNLPRTL
jgi:hypothetical protein